MVGCGRCRRRGRQVVPHAVYPGSGRRMKAHRKVAVSIVSTGMLFAVLTGCDHAPDPYWNPHAPWSPSLPRDVGIRVTDGQLDIWTGTPCREATEVQMT